MIAQPRAASQQPSLGKAHCCLDDDPLDLIEADLICPPVVEPGGARRLVVGHLLGDLQFAAVLQVFRDAGRPEAVAPDPRADAGCLGASADLWLASVGRRINALR